MTDAEHYPAAPWRLTGDFAVSVFLLPVAEIPAGVREEIPSGTRAVTIAGRAIVGLAGVRYGPGSVLEYDELLVALLVRRGARLAVTIPQIWVTSPASRAGGRALWGIPKELMSARRSASGRRMRAHYRDAQATMIGAVRAEAFMRLPGTWTVPLPTLQRGAGDELHASNAVRGHLRPARLTWTLGAPLAWLRGRRPVMSSAITHARVIFGR